MRKLKKKKKTLYNIHKREREGFSQGFGLPSETRIRNFVLNVKTIPFPPVMIFKKSLWTHFLKHSWMKPHPWVWCIKRFAWNNSGISLLNQTKYGSEILIERWIGLNVILFVIFFLDLNSASPQWVLWLNSIPVREASRDLWLKTHILSQVLSSEASFSLTLLLEAKKRQS